MRYLQSENKVVLSFTVVLLIFIQTCLKECPVNQADQLKLSVPSLNVPLAFARGLLQKGVKATQLASAAHNEILLTRIAALIIEKVVMQKPSPFVCEMIKKCGVLRVHGITRHRDRSFLKIINEGEKINVKPSAEALLEDESVVGTSESTMYTFNLIPLKLFAVEDSLTELMDHKKICRLLQHRYPKFTQRDVDASLAVAILRDPRLLKLTARDQKLDWIALLHKPVADLSGQDTILRIVINESGTLVLDAIPIRDDMLWSANGAFAVLA